MRNKAESLQQEYRLRFRNLEAYRNSVWKTLCDEYFSRFVAPTARVLDLGAGWCEFINNITALEKYAMDLNPDTKSYLSAGICLLNQDCSQVWEIKEQSLDVVFTSNFLEHLPDKESIRRTLAHAYRGLSKDGVIICLGPNIRYLPGAYWDFWDHIVPITDHSLAELLQLSGFNVELVVPRFLPFSMSSGNTPPLFLLRLYLRSPLVWSLFGKQFLVVARKKENVL